MWLKFAYFHDVEGMSKLVFGAMKYSVRFPESSSIICLRMYVVLQISVSVSELGCIGLLPPGKHWKTQGGGK